MRNELQLLPRGNLTYRTIKGHRYCFLQFRNEEQKVCNQAVAEDQIEQLRQKIERRKFLKRNIKILEKHGAFLEKKYPQLKDLSAETKYNFSGSDNGYLTLKGDCVRSKAEVIIANELYNHKISYIYEKPLVLAGCKYTLLPDFTVCTPKQKKIIYWEHLGLMDNEKYRSKWDWKKQLYEKYGISEWDNNLIVTYESKSLPLRVELVREQILHLLQQ